MCLLVSDKTSTSATPTLAEPKEFNMGLEVPTSSPPKSPTATSPNPNIKLNKVSHLHAGCNITRR